MAVTAAKLTIEDYEILPDELARNHELVDGELVDVSGNTPIHNGVRDELISRLRPFVRERELGRVYAEQEFQFGDNAHGPDVAFIGSERQRLIEPHKRVQRFVPHLAVEVASRSDYFDALLEKAERYVACGVEEAWVLSTVTRLAFRFSRSGRSVLDADDVFETPLIPGFSLRLSDLFDAAE